MITQRVSQSQFHHGLTKGTRQALARDKGLNQACPSERVGVAAIRTVWALCADFSARGCVSPAVHTQPLLR